MSKLIRAVGTPVLPEPPNESADLVQWLNWLLRGIDYLYRRIYMWLSSLDEELDTDHLVHDNTSETITAPWSFDSAANVTFDGSVRCTQTSGPGIRVDGEALVKDTVRLSDKHTGVVWEDSYGFPTPSTYTITASGGSTQLKFLPSGTSSDFGAIPELTLGTSAYPLSLTVYGWLAHQGDHVGFFGTPAATKTAVADLSAATAGSSYGANEQTMLQDVYDKVNELLDALQSYGLV